MRRDVQRGMTLIELMIVVAIIGVIAILATVGYSRYTKTARITEATDMIAGIKTAQENYYSQTNHYLDVSNSLTSPSLYPSASIPINGVRSDWGAPCTWCKAEWSKLGLATSGKMSFSYATVADLETVDPATKAPFASYTRKPYDWKAIAGGAITKPWFLVSASADFNGDGNPTTAVSGSFMSRIDVVAEP